MLQKFFRIPGWVDCPQIYVTKYVGFFTLIKAASSHTYFRLSAQSNLKLSIDTNLELFGGELTSCKPRDLKQFEHQFCGVDCSEDSRIRTADMQHYKKLKMTHVLYECEAYLPNQRNPAVCCNSMICIELLVSHRENFRFLTETRKLTGKATLQVEPEATKLRKLRLRRYFPRNVSFNVRLMGFPLRRYKRLH